MTTRIDIAEIPKTVIRDGVRKKVNVYGSQNLTQLTKEYPEISCEPRKYTLGNRPFYGLKFLK